MASTMTTAYGRLLDEDIPGAVNFRDLGGLRTATGATIRHGQLFRAGMTNHIAPEGLKQLRDAYGLRTVIDFRGPVELEKDGVGAFAEYGIAHRNLPVVGSTALTPDEQKVRLDRMRSGKHDWFESYQFMVTEKAEAFVSFFAILAEDGALPAVFHCAGGRDRTGIAAALVLGVLGVPGEVITHDYARTGEYLMPHVSRFARHMEQMSFTHDEFARLLATTPEPMERFLAWIGAQHGSVTAFVEALGVPSATVGTVRERLLG